LLHRRRRFGLHTAVAVYQRIDDHVVLLILGQLGIGQQFLRRLAHRLVVGKCNQWRGKVQPVAGEQAVQPLSASPR